MPKDEPAFRGSYIDLVQSLWTLVRDQPILRETSLVGALQFGAFSAFWTTLAFHLQSMPAHYGSLIAGLFRLVGLVGVAAAPLAGKLADRRSPRLIVLLSSSVVLAAFATFAVGGQSVAGLACGVILLDLGMQSGHVSNMARNFSLKTVAMSRLNTVYMVTRFVGGAVGSACGNYAWSAYGWIGVSAVGLIFSLVATAVQFVMPAPSPEEALS